MLPASECVGTNYNLIRDFCTDLTLAPRGHSIVKDDAWHHVYCFAERAHAGMFQARFGGDWFDPARRGHGHSWMKVKAAEAEILLSRVSGHPRRNILPSARYRTDEVSFAALDYSITV